MMANKRILINSWDNIYSVSKSQAIKMLENLKKNKEYNLDSIPGSKHLGYVEIEFPDLTDYEDKDDPDYEIDLVIKRIKSM